MWLDTLATATEGGSTTLTATGADPHSDPRNSVDARQQKSDFLKSVGGAVVDVARQRDWEALEVLDRYLNDAAVAGIGRLRIVHGKGTGVLRRTVETMLSSHPLVAEHRPGEAAALITRMLLMRPAPPIHRPRPRGRR